MKELFPQAQKIFASHPNRSELYFTSDKMCFFDNGKALKHATDILKDKQVTEITRQECEAVADAHKQ